MAQSYSAWLTWLQDFHYLHHGEVGRRSREGQGRYEVPRMTSVEYTDRAAGMAERFQRMYMRSLRALRDLRRYTGHITINNAGPLSVAGNQQVNVTK